MSTTLAQAMTPFPYSIEPEATLADAKQMMAEHDIHHLPVTEGGAIVGIISDGDVLLAGNLAPGGAKEVNVGAVCSRNPYVVDLHERLDVVAEAMAERHLGSVLVTREGKLAGIFTTTDACALLAKMVAATLPPRDDSAA